MKVVQNIYSYVLTRPERTLTQAKKDLATSFDKSYELYYYLLKLSVDLTNLQFRRLDEAKHKYLATEEDLHPDTRFVDNRVVEALGANEEFMHFCDEHLITWMNDPIFLRLMLDRVLRSETYQNYMASAADDDLEKDFELWRQLFKKVILEDPDFEEKVESMSVYWSTEDLDVMGQFAVKTLRKLANGESNPIMPMYKDEEDREFGERLFDRAIQQLDDNNALIDSLVDKGRWDYSRIALMDRVIMCTAISEMTGFANIPPTVTLNEYIELAKLFSTPNSGQFVNGILNAAARKLGVLK